MSRTKGIVGLSARDVKAVQPAALTDGAQGAHRRPGEHLVRIGLMASRPKSDDLIGRVVDIVVGRR